MKHPIIPSLLCAVAICLGSLPVAAQDNDGTGPAPSMGPGKPGKHKGGPPGNLSREERDRLAKARDKAMEDPTVRSLQEAREALDKQLEAAMDAAVLAADPSLAPTIEKIKASKGRAKGMRDRFESLTPEQKESLKSAREAAKDDPGVVAAREKMESAKSPEERREARDAMHEAMKAAMTKKSPELAPLLEKLGPPPPHGPRGPGGGPMGPPPEEMDGQ